MLFAVFGLMFIVAALFVATPLYRTTKPSSATIAVSVVLIGVIAGGLYSRIGTPDPGASQDGLPDVQQMVDSLANRLQENPDDLAGWKMLGRSYQQLQNFPGAIAAYERAVEMESRQNGQTLADLGEAVLLSNPLSLTARAGQLFDEALTVTPGNPKALFYGGMAAAERGDRLVAADRWEALLATSPPANIQEVLKMRIAELRGEPPPAPGTAAPVVVAAVSVADGVINPSEPDFTVFIIARDPANPSPPIAAVRRKLSELPTDVPIGDSDSMIPGRVPSAFSNLEIIARISRSGDPIAQSGDWFGQSVIDTGSTDKVQILIDQQLP